MANGKTKGFSSNQGKGSNKPLYEQLKQRLKDTIQSERLKAGDRLPPIYLLSREWDVNYRTLRSAFELLENEGLISYETNKGAVVLDNSEKASRVSISYIRWQRDSFCVALYEGINRFCEEHNVELTMIDATNSHDLFINAILNPPNDSQGLLIVPEILPEYKDAVKQVISKGKKVVFLDRLIPGIETSSVSADHFTGAYKACSHLLETHHCPVGYIGYVHAPTSCKLWVEGWQEAMRNHNYFDHDPYCTDLMAFEKGITYGSDNFECIKDAARSLLGRMSKEQSPVCIFTGNNYVAKGVYETVGEFDMKVGEDVFLASIGEGPLGQSFPVPLTTVFLDSQQVGYDGARVLYDRITGNLEKSVHLLNPVELKIEESSVGKKMASK
ncbi:GntR family transcriptional regulator [Sedimentisphaera salicampi]|uniref:HTH-type transcriptional repressor CytR n=1 Tax=Sedimentisphaera salicampi TaxID=1941349 RepID=A0A1W6LMR5_9BACT|nr:GntR family transcriptional regulator [Sedimentisphaera salicampi]ARN57067.1 HTH-type transcriptional repressor CytR [Sedimentisphaera salicampi]